VRPPLYALIQEGVKHMTNVLLVSSEVVPFAKTGGLADVVGTLPHALDKSKIDARIIMPKWGCIPQEYKDKMVLIKSIYVQLGWRSQYCGILELEEGGITTYFIDNEYYFGADHLYGYIHEDMEKFAFFCKAALAILPEVDFQPDIIHCNDWQAAAIPFLLKAQFMGDEYYQDIKTIVTIHNLRYQGVWDKKALNDVFGLPASYFAADKLEYQGDVNVLKGGLVYADYITTVSPTYAEEIQTIYGGEGLDGLLRAKSGQLCGILNGISYDEYNPSKDELIYQTYNRRDFASGKRANKRRLQEDLGLAQNEDAMLIGVVSRLVGQKGFDLISQIIGELSHWNIQLVVLGTGEDRYENMFRWYNDHYGDKFSANIKFDNTLAHRIYAACDAFLMPSQFEPCGLSQIISMKYGTLPIVRETGGLKDTVEPYNEFTGEGTGFSFAPYMSGDLLSVMRYACEVFADKTAWNGIIRRAMACDFSWEASAKEYAALYEGMNG